MEALPVLASEIFDHRVVGGVPKTSAHCASEQPVPPPLLIVWDHRVGGSPKVGRERLLVEVVVEDHLARVVEMRMLHEILASQAALVADRDRAVRAGLQEQLRVALVRGNKCSSRPWPS